MKMEKEDVVVYFVDLGEKGQYLAIDASVLNSIEYTEEIVEELRKMANA